MGFFLVHLCFLFFLSYMLQLQTYCGESKVLIQMAFFIFSALYEMLIYCSFCVFGWVFFFCSYSTVTVIAFPLATFEGFDLKKKCSGK